MGRRPSRDVRAARRAVLQNALGTVASLASLADTFDRLGFVHADPTRASRERKPSSSVRATSLNGHE